MTLSETLRYIVYHRLLPAAFAFLGASALATLPALGVILIIALTEGAGEVPGFFTFLSMGLFLAVYIAAFAALPAALAIWTLRGLKAPRGWTDALAGALIGGGLAHAILFGLSGLTQPPSLYTLLFALCGLTGGGAYWIFAGRPRPHY